MGKIEIRISGARKTEVKGFVKFWRKEIENLSVVNISKDAKDSRRF